MRLLFLVALGAAFVASCAAAVMAFEGYRQSDVRSFKIALSCALPLSAVTLVLLFVGTVYQLYGYPRSDHFGFGPSWHCLSSGPKGASLCYRDAPNQKQP